MYVFTHFPVVHVSNNTLAEYYILTDKIRLLVILNPKLAIANVWSISYANCY